MRLNNATMIRISLTLDGYKLMGENLSKKLAMLYNYKQLAGYHDDAGIDDNIKYIEKLRLEMFKSEFDIPYGDFVQIFPNGIDPKYIKDGYIEVLDKEVSNNG